MSVALRLSRPRTATMANKLFLALWCLFGASSDSPAAESVRLTTDGRLKRDPVFINRGMEVIFASQHDAPRLVLKRLHLQRRTVERLHPTAPLPEFRPSYSQDEQTLSFLQMTGNDSLTLRVLRYPGTNAMAISAAKKVVWHASITPNGKRVVYSASGHIYSRPVQGGSEKRLTDGVGRHNWPTVSPDGNSVAFGSSRSGDFEIYTMKLDGSSVRRLTKSRGMDLRPNWSSDSKYLAYTSSRGGNYDIFLISADGRKQARLTNNEERDDYPAWHPSGKSVIAVTERKGMFDLYMYDVPQSLVTD